jgi:hypothetical protein
LSSFSIGSDRSDDTKKGNEINLPQEDNSIRNPHRKISLSDHHSFSQWSGNLYVMAIDIANYDKRGYK